MYTKMLVTGGARSGKSRYAQELAKELSPEGRVLYVATAKVWDEEMAVRVRKHQESRPASCDTYEGYQDLGAVIAARGEQYETILVDCLTMLLNGRLFDEIGMQDPDTLTKQQKKELEEMAVKEAQALADGIQKAHCHVIVVTNEVGMGIVPDTVLGRLFRDMAGRANQILAGALSDVTLMVSGIPVYVKGGRK